MKRITKILLAIAMTIVFLPVNADDTSNPKPVSSTRLKKTLVDTQTPRSLGDLFITCYYNNCAWRSSSPPMSTVWTLPSATER